jgi:hypothetical protein
MQHFAAVNGVQSDAKMAHAAGWCTALAVSEVQLQSAITCD